MEVDGSTPQLDSPTSTFAFVGWVATYVAVVCYLAWILLPASVLHSIGITYYPARYYALAIPAYLIFCCGTLCWLYIGWNMLITPKPTDITSVRDEKVVANKLPPTLVKCGVKDGIPLYGDIDPVDLSRAVYY